MKKRLLALTLAGALLLSGCSGLKTRQPDEDALPELEYTRPENEKIENRESQKTLKSQGRESGTYFGQKQCEFQELKDPDNTVSIRLQISNYSDVSDSLIEEAIRQMKDRMDIIGTPYAFGMDIQSEDTAVIRTNPERLSADMLQFFSDSPSLQLAYSSEIPTWDMNVKSVEIVPIGGSGNIGLQVQYTDAAAVEELTSKLRCFDQIEQIFKDCKLDDSDLDGAVFYLIEETGDQRCRLVFTRFSRDTYMSCTGNCKGHLLDGYTDEFSKTASWRPFFQKRSFEMYTA